MSNNFTHSTDTEKRVFSGMRPTGALHIGHYFGVLTNWIALQENHACWYCIVDWHALTTHYSDASHIREHIYQVCIDWLAAGIDPEKATIFVQSSVSQHAELHLALSMITQLSWLERIPSYKEQLQKLRYLDIATYGFLGYPLLQTADILLYDAELVPVGADQVAHIELAREIARKFNYLYGKDEAQTKQIANLFAHLDAQTCQQIETARNAYNQHGDLSVCESVINTLAQQGIGKAKRATAEQYIKQRPRTILVEPQASILPELAKIPGLDGQKMSKSYNNAILMRDSDDRIAKGVKTMPTDPARVYLHNPGTPEKCPVWNLHLVYSDSTTQQEIHQACTQATIGCTQCKKYVTERIIAQNHIFHQRAKQFQDKAQVAQILKQGSEQAKDTATQTMQRVTKVMGI